MGHCSCGQELLSVTEAGQRLPSGPLSASRLRDILNAHPQRLRAFKIGPSTWAIPAEALADFAPNPPGVPLHLNEPTALPPSHCPRCGQRLYTTLEAAGQLGVSRAWIGALSQEDPGQLNAFRLGARWVIPQSGVDAYRRSWTERKDAGSSGEVEKDAEQAGENEEIMAALQDQAVRGRVLELLAGLSARYWTTKELVEEARRRGRPARLRHVQRLCQQGEIAHERRGRDYLIPDAAARAWLGRWVGEESED